LSRLKWLIVAAILICIVAFFLIRGLGSSPKLSADKFAEVYVRFSIAADTLSSDSVKFEQERGRILKEAGITQSEMDEFVRRLDKRPLEWADVWKKIVEKLEQRRQQVKSP
jgi:hypothetical protein